MSIVDRVRKGGKLDVDTLVRRVEALQRFVLATEGHVPEADLVTARTVIDRAGERLALSKAHTVVALAGATGSGKSSLFNAVSGLPLSRVGARRPTTGVAHACVWGAEGAGPLLDWLGIPPSRRFARESALDAEDEVALRGLVLIDLPDFDSVEASHRTEVDRLLRLVDLMVWVMDPQKYADKVVHEQYLRQFRRYRDIMIVVLNQADRLTRADSERCVADLRRVLKNDGLDGVPAFATSAKGQPGLDQLRVRLEGTVAERQASLRRLAGDVSSAVEQLRPLVGAPGAGDRTLSGEPAGIDRLDRAGADRLAEALSAVAGAPIVADATERTYRHRATGVLGWPVTRWSRRLHPDLLRRLHLEQSAVPPGAPASGRSAGSAAAPAVPPGVPVAATSLPESTVAQRAAVAMASRSVAEHVSEGLPEPWPAAVMAASRSRLRDVPDALDVAVASADLGLSYRPLWWRLVGFLQWLGALAALGGLTWLAVRYALLFLGLPDLRGPDVGVVPLPTVLVFGGLLFGLLLSVAVRPIVEVAAERAGARAERRLRDKIRDVAEGYIVAPIREVLRSYADARQALDDADR